MVFRIGDWGIVWTCPAPFLGSLGGRLGPFGTGGHAGEPWR